MNSRFLIKNNHTDLLVFFSGWGGEETLFSGYCPPGTDWLFCDDYRSLDFDIGLLSGYKNIKVVAWSLGVWVAGHVLGNSRAPIREAVAVNGTPRPLDDIYGIPDAVFKGTLDGLNEVSLGKFRRRMCGSTAVLQVFMSHGPQRTASELKDELSALYHAIKSEPEPDFRWTAALAGQADMIFPFRNQQAFWTDRSVPIEVCNEAHYSENLFRKAIGGETCHD